MRQYLKIWKETSYGVFANPGSPVKNTDYVVVRLDQGNSFTPRPTPKPYVIRAADGFNRRVQTGSAQTDVKGNLNTILYPEQAQFFLEAMCKLTTTSGVPDTGSYTIDHAIVTEDTVHTIAYRRYLGMKVEQGTLAGSRDNVIFRLNIGWDGKQPASPNITVTDFPEPAETEFPATLPYVFTHMQSPGNLTLTTSRSEFGSFQLTVKNMLDPTFFEQTYKTRCKWCGRDLDMEIMLLYQTAADRADFEAVTARAVSARVDNGTNHFILDFKASNFDTAVEDDLPLEKLHTQKLTWSNYYDTTALTDLAMTFA